MNLPNKITTFRMICVIFVAALLLIPTEGMLLVLNVPLTRFIAWILFIVASLSDFLDGYIARKYKLETDYGKFMDPIADKLLVNTVLIILSSMGEILPICAIIMIARDTIVDAVRMNAVRKNIVVAANIFGKIKTVLQMVALIFILIDDLYLSSLLGLTGYLTIGNIILYLATAASLLSGVIYLIQNKDVFSEMK